MTLATPTTLELLVQAVIRHGMHRHQDLSVQISRFDCILTFSVPVGWIARRSIAYVDPDENVASLASLRLSRLS